MAIILYVLKTFSGSYSWSSGKEFTFQCQGYEFDPWSGNKDPTCHCNSLCAATKEKPARTDKM